MQIKNKVFFWIFHWWKIDKTFVWFISNRSLSAKIGAWALVGMSHQWSSVPPVQNCQYVSQSAITRSNYISWHYELLNILRNSNNLIWIYFKQFHKNKNIYICNSNAFTYVGWYMVVPAFIVYSFYYWSCLTVYTSMS